MDAVTYGTIPSAKIERRWSDDPESRLRRLKRPLPPPPFAFGEGLAPGAGTHEPRRYTDRTNAVKARRRRNSGVRNTTENQLRTTSF
jgi:hypothetical protein